MFLFTHKSLAFIFYLEHVKAKKITEKLLKINGHTFRTTTWNKASFASPCNINNFAVCDTCRLQTCRLVTLKSESTDVWLTLWLIPAFLPLSLTPDSRPLANLDRTATG